MKTENVSNVFLRTLALGWQLCQITELLELKPEVNKMLVYFGSVFKTYGSLTGVKARSYVSEQMLTDFVVDVVMLAFRVAREINRIRKEYQLEPLNFYELAIAQDKKKPEGIEW
jgi:hypothetical protein